MNIVANLNTVRQRIRDAEEKYHRKPNSVLCLAVSKTVQIPDICTAIDAGQTDFGENYLQEAIPKINAINVPKLTWHFIGQIQSNKTKKIATHFDWVHTVCHLKTAQDLDKYRPEDFPPLQFCIQVNLSENPKKGGISLSALPEFAKALMTFKKIQLRGLMAIPDPQTTFEAQCQDFHLLKEAKQNLEKNGIILDTLSMGMSNDLEAAICEGATIVRIGTAIFGQRK